MNYGVIDNTNHYIKTFQSYNEANNFRIVNQRFDWKVISFHYADYNSSFKQRKAVRWCESILNIKFEGNISSGLDCSAYLHTYLDYARNM